MLGQGAKTQGVACKINLIPFNPIPQSGLTRSPHERVLAFAKLLQDAGLVVTIRKTRGDDIAAACGQLAGEVQDRTHVAERLGRGTVRIHPSRVAVAGRPAAGRPRPQETNA